MDFLSLYRTLLLPKNSLGVQVDYKDSKSVIYFSHLVRKNNNVDVFKNEVYNSIDEIDSSYKNYPSTLLITGDELVEKKVLTASLDEMLVHIIPIERKDDFFYKAYELDAQYSYMCVVRKSRLDDIVKTLTERGIFIKDIHLGIHFKNNFLKLNDKSSELLSDVDKDFQLTFILGLLAYSNSISTKDDRYLKVFESYSYYGKFRNTFIILICGLLIILIINFLVYSKIRNSYSLNVQNLSKLKSELVLLDSLKYKTKLYRDIIVSNSLNVNTRYAFIFDRLIYAMPKGIILNSIHINSPIRRIREEESINYYKNSLRLSGNCVSPLILNKWIDNLKIFSWIEKIDSQDYYRVNNIGSFSLIIKLKQDEERL